MLNTAKKKTPEPIRRHPLAPTLDAKISIRASFARLALTCAADCDIRYYLNGIWVEPRAEGGAYIVATDGHRLIAIIDDTATCAAPMLLQPDSTTANKLPKINGRTDTEHARLTVTEFLNAPALMLTGEDGMPLHMQLARAVCTITGTETKYPDWRRVLPDFSKLKMGTSEPVRTQCVVSVLDAFKTGKGFGPALTPMHTPDSASSAIVYHIEGHEHVALLVMPMRDGNPSHRENWRQRWAGIKATKPWLQSVKASSASQATPEAAAPAAQAEPVVA